MGIHRINTEKATGMDNENLDENVVVTDETQTEVGSTNSESEVKPESATGENEDKLPKGLEKRLAKLTKQKYDQQRRIEELEAKLNANTNRQPEKSREEFTDDEWVEYVAEQKARQLYEQQMLAQQKEYAKQQQATEAATNWTKKINKFKDEMPDFQKVVGSADVDLPVEVLREIAESDIGPRIAYYLAQNVDEAEALVEMTQKQRDRYLTRLEIKLENPISKTHEVTKAAPTPKAQGRSSGSVNMNSLSMDDWIAARRKQVYGR